VEWVGLLMGSDANQQLVPGAKFLVGLVTQFFHCVQDKGPLVHAHVGAIGKHPGYCSAGDPG